MTTEEMEKEDTGKRLNYEFLSSFILKLKMENEARESIDIALKGRLDRYSITDWYTRVSLLNQTIGEESIQQNRDGTPKKKQGQLLTSDTKGLVIHYPRDKKLDLVQFYAKETQAQIEEQKWLVHTLDLGSESISIEQYPRGSFLIRFDFTLSKPYISKDDVEFYVVDNPVRKEWVFKVPYISGSQWKGALRHSMVRFLEEKFDEYPKDKFVKRRLAITRIFGNEVDSVRRYFRGEDTDEKRKEFAEKYESELRRILEVKENQEPLVSGRVFFFPTYFSKISLEVINPHTEEVSGTNPIYFETVPEGSSGTFCLLYVPLTQCWGTNLGDIGCDLKLIKQGIHDMMRIYGFGAKTSLGYGRASQSVTSGEICWKTKEKKLMKKFSSLGEMTDLEV